MLRLRSISLRNWCKVATSEITFPANGLVHVLGCNRTATGKVESSGSGKTALGEAINRALLGASLSTSLAAYSRDEEGDTYVSVHAELREKPLHVEIGYKCPEFPTSSGEGLRFTYDEHEAVERPRVAQTRKELSELIGVSPEVSMWTVFLDGYHLKFNRLSQSDALNLLMAALNQPPWDSYKARAETRRDIRASSVERAQAKLSQTKASLVPLAESIKAAEQMVKAATEILAQSRQAWVVRVKRHKEEVAIAAQAVTNAAAERDRLKREIKDVQQADATECGKLELEMSRLDSEWRTANSYLTEWAELRAAAESDLAHAVQHSTALRLEQVCPTCRRPIGKRPDQTVLSEAQDMQDTLEKSVAQKAAKEAECRKCLNAIDDDLAATRKQLLTLKSSQLGNLSRKLEITEEELSRSDRKLRATEMIQPEEPSDSDLRQMQAVLGERQAQLSQAQSTANLAAAELAQAEHDLRISSYWVRGFSPEGIPNLVLRQTIEPLNDAARLISETISGGLIKVHFAAEVELADGSAKPKLSTTIDTLHGAAHLSRNSKGEAERANLIIAETQTQVGRVLRRVGYRWFDEVANHQDGIIRRNVYSHLRQQAHEHNLLTFVVCHHGEAAQIADHVLIADKSETGLTTYRWE